MKYQIRAIMPDGVRTLAEFDGVTRVEMVNGAIHLEDKDSRVIGIAIIAPGTWLEIVPAIIH